MWIEVYDSTDSFGREALDVLLDHEVQNNLPISFIKNDHGYDTGQWLMATIKDDHGSIVLTAACTPPFNLVLYETRNQPNAAAISYLSDHLKDTGFKIPGILAEQGLAHRFALCHAGTGRYQTHLSMHIMRLDKVNPITKASGQARPLHERDLFYIPYWERAFAEECSVESYDLPEHTRRVRQRLGKETHYIWEDGLPVSQAVHGRSTENGAVVNAVYTPPHYRGNGYASSVVAELSQILLDRGNQFCCLFADAKNPISCGIYRKIGYENQCIMDELKFREVL